MSLPKSRRNVIIPQIMREYEKKLNIFNLVRVVMKTSERITQVEKKAVALEIPCYHREPGEENEIDEGMNIERNDTYLHDFF